MSDNSDIDINVNDQSKPLTEKKVRETYTNYQRVIDKTTLRDLIFLYMRQNLENNNKHITKYQCKHFIEAFMKVIRDAVIDGSKVQLQGWGSFSARRREARRGQDPQTMQQKEYPRKWRVYFKEGKSFKEATAQAGDKLDEKLKTKTSRVTVDKKLKTKPSSVTIDEQLQKLDV